MPMFMKEIAFSLHKVFNDVKYSTNNNFIQLFCPNNFIEMNKM